MSMTIESGVRQPRTAPAPVVLGEGAHHLDPQAHAVARVHAPGVDHAAQREDAVAGVAFAARGDGFIEPGQFLRGGRRRPLVGMRGSPVPGPEIRPPAGGGKRRGARAAARRRARRRCGATGPAGPRAPAGARAGPRGRGGRSRRPGPARRRGASRCGVGAEAIDVGGGYRVSAEERPVGLGGLGVQPLLLEKVRGVGVVARGRVLPRRREPVAVQFQRLARRAGGRPCSGRSSPPRCSCSVFMKMPAARSALPERTCSWAARSRSPPASQHSAARAKSLSFSQHSAALSFSPPAS